MNNKETIKSNKNQKLKKRRYNKKSKKEKANEIKRHKEEFNYLKDSLEYIYSTRFIRNWIEEPTSYTDAKVKKVNELLRFFIWNYDIQKYDIEIEQSYHKLYLRIFDINNNPIECYTFEGKNIVHEPELTGYYQNGYDHVIQYERNLTFKRSSQNELFRHLIQEVKNNPDVYCYKTNKNLKGEQMYIFKKKDLYSIIQCEPKKFKSLYHDNYERFNGLGFKYTDYQDIHLTIKNN